MTLNQFKAEATRRGNYEDNTANAMKYWATCWGLGYHSQLWCYKKYTVGNMTYKAGPVRLRHGSYRSVSCYINGESVSEYRFKKALESFVAPVETADELERIAERDRKIEESYRLWMQKQQSRQAKTASRRKANSSQAIDWPRLPFSM